MTLLRVFADPKHACLSHLFTILGVGCHDGALNGGRIADLCGFTLLSQTVTPTNLAQTVNGLFSEFDQSVTKLELFKVDTIGDAYIGTSILPEAETLP